MESVCVSGICHLFADSSRGGFRGKRGGGRTPPPSQGFHPLPTQRVPFDTFQEIHFWLTLKFFKSAFAPIYTNFEKERAPKKRKIFVKIFQKVPKNGFFDCFFKKFSKSRKFCQGRGKTVLWKSSKNQFGRPTKTKGRQNFLKIRPPPPPLEKILDPPLDSSNN